MKKSFFSPRGVLLGLVAVLLALSLAGWAYWSLSALAYRHAIDRWIEEGRAAGYQISYDDRQMFGFPRHLTMRLINVRWRNADGIDFRAQAMDLLSVSWIGHTFEARFKNHVSIAAPVDEDGHILMLSAESGHGHVTLDSEGFWRQAQLSLDDIQGGLAPAYLFHAEKLSLALARPDQPPKDHHEVGLTLEGAAETMTLPAAMPAPFGDKAAKFTARLRVMGPVPDVRRRASVEAWNKDSGIVEFDDFSLSWGVLSLASKGTVGFDDDLQPEGAFAGTVANPEKTLQLLMDKGFILLHDAGMLKSAMDLFARPSVRGTPGMELPITVQLGGLFFGPIRIFTFPEIDWPKEPPPPAR